MPCVCFKNVLHQQIIFVLHENLLMCLCFILGLFSERDLHTLLRSTSYFNTTNKAHARWMQVSYFISRNIFMHIHHSKLFKKFLIISRGKFLFSSIGIEESIGFVQIFDFGFLMDLHILGCPEHDLTIFGKCICLCMTNFAASIAQTNEQNFMEPLHLVSPQHKLVYKFLVQIVQQMVLQSFSKFFGMHRSRLLLNEILQKFIYKVYILLEKTMVLFLCTCL